MKNNFTSFGDASFPLPQVNVVRNIKYESFLPNTKTSVYDKEFTTFCLFFGQQGLTM